MGYWVGVSGRIRMTEEAEATAVAALGHVLWRGDEIDGEVSSLGDLVWDTVITREGDWLRFEHDDDGDPKWGDRSNAFYSSLGRWATEGRIDVEGEDGQEWSYLYGDGTVTLEGTNGWDDSTTATPLPDDAFGGVSLADRTPQRSKEQALAMQRRGDVATTFREFGRDSTQFRDAVEAARLDQVRSQRQRDGGGARVVLLSSGDAAGVLEDRRAAVGSATGSGWPAATDDLGLVYLVAAPSDTRLIVDQLADPLRRGVGSAFWPSIERRDELLALVEASTSVVVVMTMGDDWTDEQRAYLDDLGARLGAVEHENRSWAWVDATGTRQTIP